MAEPQQPHRHRSTPARASVTLLLLLAGATSGCNQTQGSNAAARTEELKRKLDAEDAVGRLADEQVAHVPEGRRAGARMMAAQAIRLNQQGFTCAEVINASPLPGTDAVVVTCREALFEDHTVRYRVDPRTGETTKL